MLEALLQVVGAHVLLELLLVTLEGRRSGRIGEDVALDKLFSLGTVLETLLQIVGGALTLKLEGFCLEGSAWGRG